MLEDGEEKKLPLSLSDILTFATGASVIPPMGFAEHPSVVFKTVEEAGNDLPSASTCSNILYLPTAHWKNYELFKYKLAFAVTCSVGFGQV